MSSKTETRRAALRDRLVDIAEDRIARDGVLQLRARDLAQEAGCSVGAIYNAAADLNDLVLAVNARTFARLGQDITAALTDAPAEPRARMIVMAQAYHAFAARDVNRWRALFDMQRDAGAEAPDWYLERMNGLLGLIAEPLSRLYPEDDAQTRALMTRGLFSAIHGIVALGVDQASAGVPPEQVDRMIALLLTRLEGAA